MADITNYNFYPLTAAGHPSKKAMRYFRRRIKKAFVTENKFNICQGAPEVPKNIRFECASFGGVLGVVFGVPEGKSWKIGASIMAKILGWNDNDVWHVTQYRNFNSLQCWARDNPEIWGNENGFELFSSPKAYVLENEHRNPSTPIIYDHLGGALERLPE